MLVRSCKATSSGIDDCGVAVHHDIAGLAEAWRGLETRAGGTVFQSYAWCSAWDDACRATGYRDHPCVITVTSDDRIVLIWPLVVARLGPFRVLQSLGTPATQYSDALVESATDHEQWLWRAWRAIRSLRDIDALLLKGVRSDAMIASLLAADRDPSLVRLAGAPFVDFRVDGAADPLRARSGRTRNALQRHLRNLAKHGGVEFAIVETADQRRAAILEALHLKNAWLDRTSQVSAGYAHPANAAFLQQLAAHDDFLIVRLRVGGETAAIEAGLQRGHRYWSLVQSYDGRYAQHGPGRLLSLHLIERAESLGIEMLDFLAPAYPHKRELANGETSVRDYILPMRARGWMVLAFFKHARPRLKEWLRSVRMGLHRGHLDRAMVWGRAAGEAQGSPRNDTGGTACEVDKVTIRDR